MDLWFILTLLFFIISIVLAIILILHRPKYNQIIPITPYYIYGYSFTGQTNPLSPSNALGVLSLGTLTPMYNSNGAITGASLSVGKGSNIFIAKLDKNNYLYQQWNLIPQGTNTQGNLLFLIQNVQTKQYLQTGTNIQGGVNAAYYITVTSDQKQADLFVAIPNNGTYIFQNNSTKAVLNVAGGNQGSKNGTVPILIGNVTVIEYTETATTYYDNEQWSLQTASS